MCSHCSRQFKSQTYVARHESSVHHKSTPYFCSEQECSRSRKGFTRKDNYETHLRRVHGKSSKGANQIKRRDGDVLSHIGTGRETLVEDGLEGYSWEKLAAMAMNEREKFRMEQRRREEVEGELKNLRQRYDEREDMWLKFFIAKEGGK